MKINKNYSYILKGLGIVLLSIVIGIISTVSGRFFIRK